MPCAAGVTMVWVPWAYVAHDPVAWNLFVGSLLGLGLCVGVWALVELLAYVWRRGRE